MWSTCLGEDGAGCLRPIACGKGVVRLNDMQCLADRSRDGGNSRVSALAQGLICMFPPRLFEAIGSELDPVSRRTHLDPLGLAIGFKHFGVHRLCRHKCGQESEPCGSVISAVHRSQGELIATLAIERAQKRLRQAKQVARKRVHQGPALPGKLADCIQQDLSQAELFLVEGDSAGGSAKQARNKDFQAILPLRGKILNSWEVDSSQVLASQEIHDISVAIGIDPGSEDLSGLRYGKICILADADSDGAHIATLICALFLRHFKPLVTAGHVFVAMPPLYRIDAGKAVHYALDDEEKDRTLASLAQSYKGKVNVQRFKGLGEMNPLQLRETTMDPNTRRLIQLTLSDESSTMALMDMMLAKKRAADRKAWLESKGDLAGV